MGSSTAGRRIAVMAVQLHRESSTGVRIGLPKEVADADLRFPIEIVENGGSDIKAALRLLVPSAASSCGSWAKSFGADLL